MTQYYQYNGNVIALQLCLVLHFFLFFLFFSNVCIERSMQRRLTETVHNYHTLLALLLVLKYLVGSHGYAFTTLNKSCEIMYSHVWYIHMTNFCAALLRLLFCTVWVRCCFFFHFFFSLLCHCFHVGLAFNISTVK